ncbi:MAG: hypothetical protein KGY53_03380 [Wenzhouxiangellaceae bacterium]|nr:hypothetical protein [Wenzhouxiangellaceae bacterium]
MAPSSIDGVFYECCFAASFSPQAGITEQAPFKSPVEFCEAACARSRCAISFGFLGISDFFFVDSALKSCYGILIEYHPANAAGMIVRH